MTKTLSLFLVLLLVDSTPAPPGKYTFVDLQPLANQRLADNFGSGSEGNNLAPAGKDGRTFGGANFKLGPGLIQLGSSLLAEPKPARMMGIRVANTCVKIHILHATQYGNGQGVGKEGMPGDPLFVADGTKIAEYTIRFEDGSSATIPVVYGEDVRDWWFTEKTKGVTRGKVVWQGENEWSKSLGSQIRLYLTTWENPNPDKKIIAIDYAKIGVSPAAPFCVAITLEAKEGK